jgi:hypothetical protein
MTGAYRLKKISQLKSNVIPKPTLQQLRQLRFLAQFCSIKTKYTLEKMPINLKELAMKAQSFYP